MNGNLYGCIYDEDNVERLRSTVRHPKPFLKLTDQTTAPFGTFGCSPYRKYRLNTTDSMTDCNI
jgi:hypothetical protein